MALARYLAADGWECTMWVSRARPPFFLKAAETTVVRSLLFIASLDDLNARIVSGGGVALPMNRFRPNLVISGCAPYAEDRLGEIVIGDAVFRAVKPCIRCQVTTTDQAAGVVRGPEPLQTLATYRDSANGVMFGMNLIPMKMATVRVGDLVTYSL